MKDLQRLHRDATALRLVTHGQLELQLTITLALRHTHRPARPQAKLQAAA